MLSLTVNGFPRYCEVFGSMNSESDAEQDVTTSGSSLRGTNTSAQHGEPTMSESDTCTQMRSAPLVFFGIALSFHETVAESPFARNGIFFTVGSPCARLIVCGSTIREEMLNPEALPVFFIVAE